MKVLLLNQVFYPDVAATAQHGHDLARDLVRATPDSFADLFLMGRVS